MNDRKVENDTGVPKLSPKNVTQRFPISTSPRTVINRYFCIKGVKEAILARRGIIKRQRAKIAVHALNANIIFCKIINHLNPP
jgi:hypothetical protein